MSGLYLHIPFCKQACHYCNFHFSTSLKHKDGLIDAILAEMEWQKPYWDGEKLSSIYFGGGTPSILSEKDLQRIFDKIYALFDVKDTAEITLEANPDDLYPEKIKALQKLPINRLSIGVQSFFAEDLTFWNRAHNADEAMTCIQKAQDAGFENLTVDLIYGSPTTSHKNWLKNIQQLLQFKIPHLSCYALTVEEKTALAHFIKTGKAKPLQDHHAAHQFELLMDIMEEHNYDHYEISNFAKPGAYAVHNSAYWKGEKYLGIGPAAHTYDGQSRQWNIPNNAHYIKAVNALKNNDKLAIEKYPLFEQENLSQEQRYNEYIMTGLRTIWGCTFEKLAIFDEKYHDYLLEKAIPWQESGHMLKTNTGLVLTKKGKLLADNISVDLFWDT